MIESNNNTTKGKLKRDRRNIYIYKKEIKKEQTGVMDTVRGVRRHDLSLTTVDSRCFRTE